MRLPGTRYQEHGWQQTRKLMGQCSLQVWRPGNLAALLDPARDAATRREDVPCFNPRRGWRPRLAADGVGVARGRADAFTAMLAQHARRVAGLGRSDWSVLACRPEHIVRVSIRFGPC